MGIHKRVPVSTWRTRQVRFKQGTFKRDPITCLSSHSGGRAIIIRAWLDDVTAIPFPPEDIADRRQHQVCKIGLSVI